MRNEPRGDAITRISAANGPVRSTIGKFRRSRSILALLRGAPKFRSTPTNLPSAAPRETHAAPITVTARTWPMSVLSVAERSLPQCYHYRLRQKERLLRQLGVPFDELGIDDGVEALSRLQLARVLIVYRLPEDRRMTSLIEEARRLRIPVVFEVDDVVYRRDLVSDNPNLDTLPWSLRDATVQGAEDYLNMLSLVDVNLASTELLAADMQSRNGRASFVLENGIDDHMREVVAGLALQSSPRNPDPVIIYGSGSRAHDHDFELAAHGLAQWLQANPKGRLTLVGSVAVPEVLTPLARQIKQLPGLPFPEYLRELSRSTIALAPLTSDAFNRYKSHIRYLESGLVGTPLIASPTVYSNFIDDGRTGIIAEDGQWFSAISRLAADPSAQRRMTCEAGEHVREWELNRTPSHQMRALLSHLVPEWGGQQCA